MKTLCDMTDDMSLLRRLCVTQRVYVTIHIHLPYVVCSSVYNEDIRKVERCMVIYPTNVDLLQKGTLLVQSCFFQMSTCGFHF